jgi:hypothetical protein
MPHFPQIFPPVTGGFVAETGRYTGVNAAYPGLEHIHQGPNIFVVRGFFSPEECAALVSKAGTALNRSVHTHIYTHTNTHVHK